MSSFKFKSVLLFLKINISRVFWDTIDEIAFELVICSHTRRSESLVIGRLRQATSFLCVCLSV